MGFSSQPVLREAAVSAALCRNRATERGKEGEGFGERETGDDGSLSPSMRRLSPSATTKQQRRFLAYLGNLNGGVRFDQDACLSQVDAIAPVVFAVTVGWWR